MVASRRSLFAFPIFFYGLVAIAAEGDAYLFRISTVEEFERFSIAERFLPGVDRITKFLAPSREDPSLLPVVFQNVNQYKFHQDFMAAEFRERFPGLGGEEYLALVERRSTRSYFAGVVFRFKGTREASYGFDVFTLSGNSSELPTYEETLWIFRKLAADFKVGVPAYAPRSANAIENAKGWKSPEFPINYSLGDAGDTTYQAYTITSNYGRVRVFTSDGFAKANESGGFGLEDIVVVDEAPADIEGVIAGVITGSIQSDLGHLALRSARRGTPNAFVKNATQALKPHDGKLVFLELSGEGYRVTDAQLSEAEAWWVAHRPNLSTAIQPADAEYKALDKVGEAVFDGPVKPVARYGGKGANFLRLYTLLPEENRVPGFVVPFFHYRQFLESNHTVSLKDPARQVTFAKLIEELLQDPDFRGNSRKRFVALEALRQTLEKDGVVDPLLVKSLAQRVEDVFGTVKKAIRCRSSSNAEDLLEFNGAGLYSSTGACAADDLDDDRLGPSACDPGQEGERGLARGLKRVWASLWNFRAYEEREYYQIPHLNTKMAVLISEAFPDELANGVAFTGNPALRGDRRFLVNAQLGDNEVVFTNPGVVAEKDVLEMANGRVAKISRVRASSLVPPGTFVLRDDHLEELGSLLALVEGRYPFEYGWYSPQDVLLDFEFKLDRQTRRIRLKQVRPFLIPTTTTNPPASFSLRVPEGIVACASFNEGRANGAVFRSKARLGLRAGQGNVRSDGTTSADLFEWLQLSPGGPRAPPEGPGVWKAEPTQLAGGGFKYSTSQDFIILGQRLRVSLVGLFVTSAETEEVVLDPATLTWSTGERFLHLEYTLLDTPPENSQATWILPCDLSHLPRSSVDVQFATGDRVRFEERFQEVLVGTGPAELVYAKVNLGESQQVIEDYWRLVYSAGHHNDTPYPELWAILDPPIDVSGAGRARVVGVAQGFKGQEPQAFLLDENFNELERPEIIFFRRHLVGAEEVPQFKRGDANASGRINVSDAIAVLSFLYQGGPLACPDAADFDDIGSIERDDAILILRYLFLGLDPPAAPGPRRCGVDVEPDDLPPCEGRACR